MGFKPEKHGWKLFLIVLGVFVTLVTVSECYNPTIFGG